MGRGKKEDPKPKKPSASKVRKTKNGARRDSPPSETSFGNPSLENKAPIEDLAHGAKSAATITFPIVGIGGSAGGLEALQALLEDLSTIHNMSYVLIQHLDPTHASALAAILSKSTKLPIVEAFDGMAVERNTIYVIPPDATLFLLAGYLRIQRRKPGVHTPVDAFFHSLAHELGRLAIGVILSGTGSDGSRGVEAIKTEGGVVFAQDARTAKYPQMPLNAIATGCVDFVLSPKDIALELSRISQDPNLSRLKEIALIEHFGAEDKGAYRKILNLLHVSSKVDFSNYKHSTIQRRLYRRMLLHKVDSFTGYVLLLKNDPSELQALYNELLINVTSFFRNPHVFQALIDEIIPDIIKKREPDKPIRIWVPGCSSGQEVYSLLICFCEALGEDYRSIPLQAFATDISEITIDQARVGIYPANIREEVSSDRLRRFFVKLDDDRYQIKKFIRDMCVFAKQNVNSDPPFSRIDLISCRNLLIYFDITLQKKVIPIFHYSLKESGLLLLGSSESINSFPELFVARDKTHSIYIKKPISTKKPYFDFLARTFYQPNLQPEVKHNFQKPSDLLQEIRVVSERMILDMFAPCSVIVNDELDIIHTQGDTGSFLSLRPGTATLNILKMARDTLPVDLRILLHKVKKDGQSAKKDNLTISTKGHSVVVSIEVHPIKSAKVVGRNYLVLFRKIKDIAASEKSNPSALGSSKGRGKKQDISEASKNERIDELMNEIDDLKEALQSVTEGYQSTIEEQEAINEEIKTSNEELLSSNEELQSTTEELETAKEELHSTNEELSTVNLEVQNRNLELTLVNSDLANLFESVRIPVVMLGSDLRIRKLTPNAQKLFNLIPSDIGRPITDIQSALLIPDLPTMMRDVLKTLDSNEIEVRDFDGHWYLLRIQPYATSENKIDGVVLVVLDIDALKTSLDFTQSIIDSLQNAVVVFDESLKIFAANPAFLELLQISIAETRDAKIFDIKKGILDLPILRDLVRTTSASDVKVQTIDFEIEVSKDQRRYLILNSRRMSPGIAGLKHMTLFSIEDATVLNKAVARFQKLLENAPDAMVIVNRDYNIELINARTQTLFGYTRDELVGRNVEMIVPERFRDKLKKSQIKDFPNWKSHLIGSDLKFCALRKDGTEFPVEVSFSLLDGEDGVLLSSAIRDISDRKRAREELIESEERNRLILESVLDAFAAFDSDGKIITWNRQAECSFGWSHSEAVGENIFDLIIPRHFRSALKQGMDFSLKKRNNPITNKRIEISATHKVGHDIPVEMTISSAETSNGSIFHAFLNDISERKLSEEKLKLNAAIAENMSEGVVLVRADDKSIVYTNSTFERMFGYNQKELLGNSIAIVHTPLSEEEGTRILNSAIKSLKENGAWCGEFLTVRKDGVQFWCSTNLANLPRDAAQSENLWIVVYCDISQRKAAEESLLQSTAMLRRSNAELKEFAYVASHDLQEPLRKVSNYVGLFAEAYRGKLDESTEKYLKYILDGTKRMRILIEDLLKFSTLSSQDTVFEEVDLSDLLKDVLSDFSQLISESQATVSVGPLPLMQGSRIELSQLFSNLISNALKFHSTRPLKIDITSTVEENEVHILVADNGIGIEEEYRNQIFGLFRRLHSISQYSGTGIGLSICKKVVENHNGKIWVESEFGTGSTFHITLPTGSVE